MGKALRDVYRERAFLMPKIDGRSRKEAMRQLDESLKRVGVETIDLVLHHEVLRFEDPHRIFDDDGANAALVDARTAGKLRYIGFTGHKDPRIHLHTLAVARENGFAFDTVQMPLNVMDAHYRSFERLVLPELLKDGTGVLGMKPLANGLILKSGTVTAVECLHYALALPASVVITGVESMERLEQALEAVRTFESMDVRHSIPCGRKRERRPHVVSTNCSRPPRSSTPRPTTLSGSARSPSTSSRRCSNRSAAARCRITRGGRMRRDR
jgi:aryl-alcohol dehydrogenase-like predicted oxidoreductase